MQKSFCDICGSEMTAAEVEGIHKAARTNGDYEVEVIVSKGHTPSKIGLDACKRCVLDLLGGKPKNAA